MRRGLRVYRRQVPQPHQLGADLAVIEAEGLALDFGDLAQLRLAALERAERGLGGFQKQRRVADLVQQPEGEENRVTVGLAVFADRARGDPALHAVAPEGAQVQNLFRNRGEGAHAQAAEHQVVQLHQADQADRLVEGIALAGKSEVLAARHAHDPHRQHRITPHDLDEIVDRRVGVE